MIVSSGVVSHSRAPNDVHFDSTREAAAVELGIGQRPEVHLVAVGGVKQLKHAPLRQRIASGELVEEVAWCRESTCQAVDRTHIDFDHQVDVVSRSRLALQAGRK